MTGYEKIKKFVSEVHEINCALTDEIIEFIDEVIEQEQVGNVAKPNACPQLYDVRTLGEAICDMGKYISDESSMLGEKYKKVVEKYNKVSEHFI
jgi:hypothetical protein